MRLASVLFVLGLSTAVIAAPATAQVSRTTINRILDEGMNRSQVMETAAHLTDRIGGRMTNSPQMRQAERWTQEQFRSYGLSNVHTEGFEFGRGWSINRSSVRMVAPRPLQLRAIPVAWTPATNGTLTGPIIVAPIREDEDFARWRGQLRGKIVLVTRPDNGQEPTEPAFSRLTEEQLRQRNTYRQPEYAPDQIEEGLARADFQSRLDAFLAEEGALAWVRMSRREGGLLHGEGNGFRVDQPRRLPGVEIAAEDYRRLARLARTTDAQPSLEIMSDVQFHDEDTNGYNVLADIAGTDARAGYVMAGAHLDS